MTSDESNLPDRVDWREDSLGQASLDERRLLAAVLQVDQASRSSTKWDPASRVLANAIGARPDQVGGVGIQDGAAWAKHRHNRTTQKGFHRVPVSVFVADSEAVIDRIAGDYSAAMQRGDLLETALIVLRRNGQRVAATVEDAGEHARIVKLVSTPQAQYLAALTSLAPHAELVIIDVSGRVNSPATQSTADAEIAEELIGGNQCWILHQSDSSRYFDVEGVSYHFLRTTRASGEHLTSGDWVLMLRSSDSRRVDRGRLFGLGRVGRVHRKGDDRYAVFDLFWAAPTGITFAEIGGDPRPTPQNPMAKVPQGVVAAWAERAGLTSRDQLDVPAFAMSLASLRDAAGELVLPPGTLESCLAALRSGKHLLLTGPPGTGKSTLAIALAKAACASGMASDPLVTTGTADWTSVETIGAYRLSRERQDLEFHPGHFLESISRDSWLVIDELNRADIDKAVGQVFSVLSGHPVVLPFETSSGEPISIVPAEAEVPEGTWPYTTTPHWRLVATMNERDKDLLFSMSEAFMRRFAVVRIAPPNTEADWERAISGQIDLEPGLTSLIAKIGNLASLDVGPAVLLDCARYIANRLAVSYEVDMNSTLAGAVSEAVQLMLEPQLAGLLADDRNAVIGAIRSLVSEFTESLPQSSRPINTE